MKLLQFAVASIVDANTVPGLAADVRHTQSAAHASYGRTIRSKSILALLRLIREKVFSSVSSYQARIKSRRELATIAKLDDRLLRDIGLSRADIYAAQSGAVSIEQLKAERRKERKVHHTGIAQTSRLGVQTLQLEAVNEIVYSEAKCA